MPRPPRPTPSVHRFRQELDRLFREAMGLVEDPPEAGRWQPQVDVVETEETFQVLVEVPGIRAEELRVEVQGQTVIVTGRKEPSAPDGSARFHRLERGGGSFERTIDIAGPVNTHQGTALLAGGVLTVELPRIRERRERRQILVVEENGETTS